MTPRPSYPDDMIDVLLAVVLSEQIKQHVGLNYLESPRVGAFTVRPWIARLVDQNLSAVLDRIDQTAGVRLRADFIDRILRLEVLADDVQLLYLVIDLHLR